MLTERHINRNAAWLLYRQAISLLAFIEEVERMGWQDQFPNYAICKAECMGAIAEAETMPIYNFEADHVLNQAPIMTFDFMEATNAPYLSVKMNDYTGEPTRAAIFLVGKDHCKAICGMAHSMVDKEVDNPT